MFSNQKTTMLNQATGRGYDMRQAGSMHIRAGASEAVSDSSLFFRGLVFAVAGSVLPWAALGWYLCRGSI
jgi:hypothetical protein